MKYVITQEQYNLISEALGVPNNILEAAEEFYEIFLNDFKSIEDKEDEYRFNGYVDIILGDKKKIKIDEYTLKVEVQEHEEFDEHPQIASMAMGQEFIFDRDIMRKRTDPSTNAQFSMTFIANPNWEPKELYEEFLRNKENNISSLAHELKHKYDKQAKQIDLIGRDAEYIGSQKAPRFRIPSIDSKFLYFLYFTNAAENLVRTTEVASHIRSKKITQEQFREFLENNNTFKTLVRIKNFTFEDLVGGIAEHMDRVDEILRQVGENPEDMNETQKIVKILDLIYVNLASTQIETFMDYVNGPLDGLMDLLKFFGGETYGKEAKMEKMKMDFQKYIRRYEKNSVKFFEDEIKKFHDVANKMIKKLSKLYALTQSNKTTNESIINWELHNKIMEKKYGNNIVEDLEYGSPSIRRRLNTIEELISKEIELSHEEKNLFSDEYEFANNIISWVTDAFTNLEGNEKYDYDETREFIQDHFGEMIMSEYIDFYDEDDDEDDEDF